MDDPLNHGFCDETGQDVVIAKDMLEAVITDGPEGLEHKVIRRIIECPHDPILFSGGPEGPLQAIMRDSGATIEVDEKYRDPRRITVYGGVSSVGRAARIIDDMLQRAIRPIAEATVTIMCPNEAVGGIIGKGGSTVKDIQRISGANIQIKDTEDGFTRRVIISGDSGSVRHAEEMVNKMMNDALRGDDRGRRRSPSPDDRYRADDRSRRRSSSPDDRYRSDDRSSRRRSSSPDDRSKKRRSRSPRDSDRLGKRSRDDDMMMDPRRGDRGHGGDFDRYRGGGRRDEFFGMPPPGMMMMPPPYIRPPPDMRFPSRSPRMMMQAPPGDIVSV